MTQIRQAVSKLHYSSVVCKKEYLRFFIPVLLNLIFFFHFSARAQTGVYTLNGGTASESDKTYSATDTDQSAVYVLNSGSLTLTNCTVTKTGDASNVDNSSKYGINAGILANKAGVVTITGCTISTDAEGANGLFASDNGSSITMTNGSIVAKGGRAHGVDVTYGGSITLINVDVTTTKGHSSAIATDFGGGTVTVTGGTIIAADTDSESRSAGIYSTGVISVTDATVSSMNNSGGVIDGANSIILQNTDLSGVMHGIMTWKTAPANGPATVTIDGGSLTALSGDALYVNGTTGNSASATLSVNNGATISTSTGKIVNVVSSSSADFTADAETLTGDFEADETSTLAVTLKNGTTFTGSAQNTEIILDASSSWILTEDSYVTSIDVSASLSGSAVSNITGNGFDVFYDPDDNANSYLNGGTYSLVNGGYLAPEGSIEVETGMNSLPSEWILEQNYPNPFNPSTTIEYQLPKTANVTISIYEINGKLIKEILNRKQNEGVHRVIWDGTNQNNIRVASGIYIYTIKSDNLLASKKLILIK